MANLMQVFRSAIVGREKALSPVSARGGWWPIIREAATGNWQRNITVNRDTVLTNPTVFACQTRIASDISKLPVRLMAKADGIWQETTSPAYSPVLRKPNRYQKTFQQFLETWVLSKLQYGNAYILKRRDNRNVVVEMHVLDPMIVKPLVSDEGDVFYELNVDRLSGVVENLIVPESEIIHDRFNCLHHPLVGLSPIMANGLAATQGLAIQSSATKFFENNSQPGGILSAPGVVKQETADRLKAYWEQNYTGDNAGKIAVLGDGLKYEALAVKAVDAQLIEQLKWTAEIVASTYHVPAYKVGVGSMPTYANVQSLNTQYYTDCLQVLVTAIESCLSEGLGIGEGVLINGSTYKIDIDEDALLRMDSLAQMEVLEKSKGKLTVNEQRSKLNRSPVTGGDTVYLQEQDHSLEWLARRDAMPVEAPAAPAPENDNEAELQAARALLAMRKGLSSV